MRVNISIAVLAAGVALSGCGMAPGLAVQQAAQNGGTVGKVYQADEIGRAGKTGEAEKIAKEAEAGKIAMPEAEPSRPMDAMSRAMIKKVFRYLENKHPQAKDRLHSLEQRLLALNMSQIMALKAVRFNARKSKTLDEVATEIQGLFKDPEALIADITKDLDKVEAMSAQDLASARSQLPPIFTELMQAMAEPEKKASQEESEDKVAADADKGKSGAD